MLPYFILIPRLQHYLSHGLVVVGRQSAPSLSCNDRLLIATSAGKDKQEHHNTTEECAPALGMTQEGTQTYAFLPS